MEAYFLLNSTTNGVIASKQMYQMSVVQYQNILSGKSYGDNSHHLPRDVYCCVSCIVLEVLLLVI